MLDKKNFIKIKIIIYVCAIFFLSGLIIFVANKEKARLHTNNFIELIKNKKNEQLNYEEFDKYKELIKLERNIAKNKEDINKAIYSLGVIEYSENNYKKSIEYLSEVENLGYVNLDVLSKITLSYLNLKDKDNYKIYLDKLIKFAMENQAYNELVDVYYEIANKSIDLGYSIDNSINLLDNSINIIQDYEKIIRAYLLIASLNRMKGQYEEALIYDQRALGIALDADDDKYLGKCIVSLSENYYYKRQFRKTINLLETLIKGELLKDDEDKLKVYGYLIDAYFETGNIDKGVKYKEKFLELVNNINPNKRTRELIWLHILYSNANLITGNYDISNSHYDMAKKLYEKNKEKAQVNTDLFIRKIEIAREYNENNNYIKAISEYEEMLEEIKYRGNGENLYYDLIYGITELSYKNKEKKYLDKYSKDLFEIYNEINITVDTDNVIEDLNTYVENRESYKNKYKMYGLGVLLIIAVIVMFTIYLRNVKISKSNKKLEIDNITDGLTGVYNKRYLYEVVKKSIGKEIVFIMLDIDYFKNYNDNYGHIKGDEALIIVALLLKEVFKQDLVFRYGGEEFSIVSDRNIKDVIRDVEIFQWELSELNIQHKFSEISDRVTLSMGISKGHIENFESGEALIRLSDKKLYESKTTGRNKYSF